MKKIQNTKGSSIAEVIVAIGIFMLISSNLVVLALGSHSTMLRDKERLQADMYLQQSFEAVRSIRNYDFNNLTTGTHGLTNSSGYWEISGGSSDTQGQFTRTVTIEDIQRDTSCAIVESGGTVYGSTKKITVTINWDLEVGNSTSISATEYITDWANPASCGEDGENLVIDVTGAYLSGGDKKVEGITLENIGGSTITIDRVTVAWSGGDADEVTKIKIDNNNWTGGESSGTEIDIDDIDIESGSIVDIDEIKFDDEIDGATLSLTFTMSDETTSSISEIYLE